MSAGACASAISRMQNTSSSLLCPQDIGHFFLSGCEKSVLTDVATSPVLLNAWPSQELLTPQLPPVARSHQGSVVPAPNLLPSCCHLSQRKAWLRWTGREQDPRSVRAVGIGVVTLVLGCTGEGGAWVCEDTHTSHLC